nr:hypothetical protein B0A51_10492 [Rachicladosporium sp. CCFEE 5018]
MAEALCGPSNALQQFKQSTQHDRTLQQDRLVSRHRPAQGFRSHDPNVAHMDAEFEAFQAGVPLDQFQQYNYGPLPGQQHFPEPVPQAPSWAADFSQMSLQTPSVQQGRTRPMPDAANWSQELRMHSKPMPLRAQQMAAASPQAFQQNARYGPPGFRSNFAQPAFAPIVQGKGKAAVTEDFDEAAFERAFDLARDDMMTDAEVSLDMQENAVQTEAVVDNVLQSSGDRTHVTMQDVEAVHSLEHSAGGIIANVQNPEQEQREDDGRDDDALAATAQDLLEKVENNMSDKFQNSQFLNLMRKLRDREVKVRGDKMVESVSNFHPKRVATPDSTYGSGTSSPALPITSPTRDNPTICNPPQCDAEFASISATNSPLVGISDNARFDNTEQIPALLDSRPPQYGMPLEGQDADLGAFSLTDGQDVAALLSEPGLPGGEPDPNPIGSGVGEDLGTWNLPCPSAGLVVDAAEQSQNTSISDMLYGSRGPLTSDSTIYKRADGTTYRSYVPMSTGRYPGMDPGLVATASQASGLPPDLIEDVIHMKQNGIPVSQHPWAQEIKAAKGAIRDALQSQGGGGGRNTTQPPGMGGGGPMGSMQPPDMGGGAGGMGMPVMGMPGMGMPGMGMPGMGMPAMQAMMAAQQGGGGQDDDDQGNDDGKAGGGGKK